VPSRCPDPSRFLFLPPAGQRQREWAAALEAAVPEFDVALARDRDEALALLPHTVAAFGSLDPELLQAAPRLRWLQCPAAGPSPAYFFDALVASDVAVTNMRGVFSDHIADHIMAFVLAFARGLHHHLPNQFRGQWRAGETPPAIYLREATAVIVGVGGIGAATAAHCAHFGMHVIGIDPRVASPPPGVRELYRPDALDEHLGRGDFVILTVPRTPQTQGLMNAARLARVKPGAVLINTGRGTSIVLDDLAEALDSGPLGGAALDVFETEPLPPGHRLWQAPNFLMTPHTADAGPYLDERRLELFLENARRFVRGDPLATPVDKANWF